MKILKQSTAYNLMVLLVDAIDHITGKPGLTLSISISKNGSSFSSITPVITDKGSGWYNIALTAANTDTLGDLALTITAVGADPLDVVAQVFKTTFDDYSNGIWVYGPIVSGTLSAILPMLRIKLGDTNAAAYRYLDTWLMLSLVAAIKALSRYWGDKYLLTDAYEVYRNPVFANFEYTAPPTIQFKDEWIIVLMASIITKSGSLENSAWDVGSWRDTELSFSNIESGKLKDASLKRDIEELSYYLKPPIKRLVTALRTDFVEAT